MQAPNPGNDSGEVMFFVGNDGAVFYASPSVENLLGYAPGEIVGHTARELIHSDDFRAARTVARAVLSTAGTRQLNFRVRRRSGDWHWLEGTMHKLPDEFRAGAIVVNCRKMAAKEDARQRAHRETDELLRSNARLEHFAFAVAHDLREPFRSISLFTELLIKNNARDAQSEVLAQFITRGVTRMSALFEGLHSFAVNGLDRSTQILDLSLVVAEVLQDLHHAITTSGATVTVGPLPIVESNKGNLLRVIQNLIANAIKYHSEAPIRIHVAAEQMDSHWIVRIRDNGVGITQEHHLQVFDLFKRLHGPEIPGGGIGLAICKKTVEAMGDTIWVESEGDCGSTFCFTIGAAGLQAGMEEFEPNPVILREEIPARLPHRLMARSAVQ